MGKWMLTSSLEEREHVDQEIEDELNEKGKVLIESSYDISDNIRSAKISFLDCGVKFNPLEKDTEPDIQERIASKRKIGGLGIFLTKKNIDELKYSYSNNTNILKLLKKENINSEVNHGNNKN